MLFYEFDNCCGVTEIGNLSEYPNPEAAMARFVGNCQRMRFDTKSKTYNKYIHLQAFYVFTAVVYERETGRHPTYGPDFAKYIRDNRLGSVKESPMRFNTNEPEHRLRVYVWAPNKKAINKWWKAYNEKLAAEAKANEAALLGLINIASS